MIEYVIFSAHRSHPGVGGIHHALLGYEENFLDSREG